MMEEQRGRGKEAEGRKGSPAGAARGSAPAPAAAATAAEPRQQRCWCCCCSVPSLAAAVVEPQCWCWQRRLQCPGRFLATAVGPRAVSRLCHGPGLCCCSTSRCLCSYQWWQRSNLRSICLVPVPVLVVGILTLVPAGPLINSKI